MLDYKLKNQSLRKEMLIGFAFFIPAVFIFSTMSPLRGGLPLNDASVFMNMGSSFLKGQIIYKDIFDHKGPLIFLLYAFGFLLGFGSTYGIFILEVLNIVLVTLIIAYLLKSMRISTIILTYSALLLLLNHGFDGGGSTEEFILLPTIASLLLYLRFHRIKMYYFLQSLFFSYVFYIKPNGIAFISAILLFSIIDDIQSIEYKKVILGVSTLFFSQLAIFSLIYYMFFRVGAHIDFLEGLILFNLNYIGIPLLQKMESAVLLSRKFTIEIGIVVLTSFFLVARNDYWRAIKIIVAAGITLFSIFLGGNVYPHYLLLFFPILLYTILSAIDTWTFSDKTNYVLTSVLVVMMLMTFNIQTSIKPMDRKRYIQRIKNYGIEQDETAMIIGYTIQTRFFLFSGIPVSQKWFIPLTYDHKSDELVNIVKSDILEKKPDYLIVDSEWSSQNSSDKIFESYRVLFAIPEDRTNIYENID